MRKLQNAFSSLRYHKKMAWMTYGLFTIFLFNLIFLSSLIRQQENLIKQSSERWKLLKSALPQINDSSYQIISTNNELLLSHYHQLILINCLVFFILSLCSGCYFFSKRRTEVLSLRFLGIRNRQIVQQALIELVYPIVLGVLTIITAFLLFQTSFTTLVSRSNQNLSSTSSIEDLVIQVKPDESTTPENTKSPTLLPFNEKSFFVKQDERTIHLKQDLFLLGKNTLLMSLLLAISTSFVTAGFCLYFTRQL